MLVEGWLYGKHFPSFAGNSVGLARADGDFGGRASFKYSYRFFTVYSLYILVEKYYRFLLS